MEESSLSSPSKSYRYSDKDKYPCTHYRSLPWDKHAACPYCILKRGSVCTQDNSCSICSSWSQDKWDRYNIKVSTKRAEMAKKLAKREAAKRILADSGSDSSSPCKAKAKPRPKRVRPGKASVSLKDTETHQTPTPTPSFSAQEVNPEAFISLMSGLLSLTNPGLLSQASVVPPTSVPKASPVPSTSRKTGISGQGTSAYRTDFVEVTNPVSPARKTLSRTAVRSGLADSVIPNTATSKRVSIRDPQVSANPSGRTDHLTLSTRSSGTSHSVIPNRPIGSSDMASSNPNAELRDRILATFNTQNPPLIPLTPSPDLSQAPGDGQGTAQLQPLGADEQPNTSHPSDTQNQNQEAVLHRFSEVLGDLPQDTQSELTAMFRQFLGDKVSIGSAASESLIDENSETEDTESPTFRSMWSSLCGAVKDWVPSVPEVGSSPQKRRRTVAALDQDLSPPSLPLHPDISSTLDAIMKEVKDGKDRSDPLVLGKFLKQDRVFPKKQWAAADKPKLHLPQVKLSKTLEQLIPGLKNSAGSISDMECQAIEAQMRESLLALSQLKWILETQLAFYSPLVEESNQEGAKELHRTLALANDWLFSFLLDSNATMLANMVLRRRDLVLSQAPSMSRDMTLNLRSQPIQQIPLMEVSEQLVNDFRTMTKHDIMVDTMTAVVKKVQDQSKGQSFRGRNRRRANRASGFNPSSSASGPVQTSGNRGRGNGLYQPRGRGRGGRGRGARSNPPAAQTQQGKPSQ